MSDGVAKGCGYAELIITFPPAGEDDGYYSSLLKNIERSIFVVRQGAQGARECAYN